MKIQQLVRSLPWVKWEPGYSICYRDTSYTKTARKVRFKFYLIGTGMKPGDWTEGAAREAEVRALLEADGHKIEDVQVLSGVIQIWQKFPIQITEVA